MKNATDVDRFVKLTVQMDRLLADARDLSKKSPDSPINKFKLGLVNDMLNRANGFLSKRDRPSPDFECFTEDSLPTCSDVVIILSQYKGCLEKFRDDNKVWNGRKWCWKLNGEESSIAI
jgi:hypothetical protein